MENMPDYITTYNGTHFTPTAPEAKDIHITDIAHALSLVCRGNGHVKQFFSVGQHCIRCALEANARGYSNRVSLACLLHDASEAYLSDVTSPVKKYLPEYRQYEDRLLAVIYEKYLGSLLSVEEEKKIKEIDADTLYYDLLELLGERQNREMPEMKYAFSYQVELFEKVEKEYLELFERFREK